jgi:hypothetical protein
MSNTESKPVDCCVEQADENAASGKDEEEHVSSFGFIFCISLVSCANILTASVTIIAVVRIINQL